MSRVTKKPLKKQTTEVSFIFNTVLPGDVNVYRYNHTKTMLWLKKKVHIIMYACIIVVKSGKRSIELLLFNSVIKSAP